VRLFLTAIVFAALLFLTGIVLTALLFLTRIYLTVLMFLSGIVLTVVANTCPWMFGGKLLALYEGGRPYSINHETLDTIEEETLDGSLRKGNNFSAHPKEDPDRR
jgi:hypothetical protein